MMIITQYDDHDKLYDNHDDYNWKLCCWGGGAPLMIMMIIKYMKINIQDDDPHKSTTGSYAVGEEVLL